MLNEAIVCIVINVVIIIFFINLPEYDRCHDPLGMENFGIRNEQITASSQKSATTPASSGRRNAVRGFGLDGAWCAATNDKVWQGKFRYG